MIVVVTGAKGSIGKAIVKEFRTKGHVVVALDRSDGDVSYSFDVSKMCEKIIKRHGRVDVLVNCAAIKLEKSFNQTSVKDFQEVIATNYLGSVYMIKALFPVMARGSHIVNIGSMHGLYPGENQTAYTASKFALTGLSRVLRDELLPLGVNVHLVCPSAVDTGDTDYKGEMLSVDAVVDMVFLAIEKNQFLVLPNAKKRMAYVLKILKGL